METIVFHKAWLKLLKPLSDEQELNFYRMLFSGAEVSETEDVLLSAIYGFVKEQADLQHSKYQEKIQRNRENGAKGGRPKKPTENPNNHMVSVGFEKKPTEKLGFEKKPTEKVANPNKNRNRNINNNENKNKNENTAAAGLEKFDLISPFEKSKYMKAASDWLKSKGNESPSAETLNQTAFKFWEKNPTQFKEAALPPYYNKQL